MNILSKPDVFSVFNYLPFHKLKNKYIYYTNNSKYLHNNLLRLKFECVSQITDIKNLALTVAKFWKFWTAIRQTLHQRSDYRTSVFEKTDVVLTVTLGKGIWLRTLLRIRPRLLWLLWTLCYCTWHEIYISNHTGNCLHWYLHSTPCAF